MSLRYAIIKLTHQGDTENKTKEESKMFTFKKKGFNFSVNENGFRHIHRRQRKDTNTFC